LWRERVRGTITDLDNTLVGAKVPHATEELIQWLQAVQKQDFSVTIVSNNNSFRVGTFADPLSLPSISQARRPSRHAFRKAMTMMNLRAEQIIVIGDQQLTDVLGGNRMGLHTILVNPISPADEGFFTRMNRRMERIAAKFMK